MNIISHLKETEILLYKPHIRGRVTKLVTNMSKTAVMGAIGFQYVSLGSSTIQLYGSLGSRHACACSETASSSKNGDCASGVYYRRVACCCAFFFLWVKGLNAKDIHKEMFPAYDERCLSRKVFHKSFEKFSLGCSK
jgi:hypothetical protein